VLILIFDNSFLLIDNMTLVLLILQVIISVLLILIILLQRSDNDGFGLGSSGGLNFLSSRGQANLLTRTTAILAAAFMANSLIMATIESRASKTQIADEIISEQQKAKDAMQIPLDGVKKIEEPAPEKNTPKDTPVEKTAPAEVPETSAKEPAKQPTETSQPKSQKAE
jgi:preprotein translocase subunit SecG